MLPTEVIVSNGDDQENDLDFSVEVQGDKGILDPSVFAPPEGGGDQAQSTLSFLDESVQVTLDRRKKRVDKLCNGQAAQDMRTRTGTATVFVVSDGKKKPTDLIFEHKVLPDAAEWEEEFSSGDANQSDITICWANVTKGKILKAAQIDSVGDSTLKTSIGASEGIQPFALFIESHTPRQSRWWWFKRLRQ